MKVNRAWGFCIFSLFVAFLASPVKVRPAEMMKKIVIVSPAWKKFTHADGTGLYFELMRRVYQTEGIQVESHIVPWARSKAMIRDGKADCMLAAYLTPGDDRWSYPQHPIDVDNTAVVFLRQTIKPWEGIDSLSGRSVVWPRGYNFHNYLTVKVDWMEVDSAKQGWGMVDRGRADFYMDILPEITAYIQKHRMDMERYRVETAFSIKTYVRFGRGPRTDALRRIYDRGFKRLFKSGKLKSLFKKWEVDFPESVFAESVQGG